MKRSFAPCSEGQRQLCALQLSQREIATALGTHHQNVARWQSSPRAPSYEIKLKLAETFAIPVSSWDVAPVADEDIRTLAADLAAKLRERADAASAAVAAAPLPDNAAQLDALIAQLRKARAGDVAPALLVKLAAAETRAVQARERLRSEVERACRHPDVIAWAEALFDAFEEHPLAELLLIRRQIEADADPARLTSWDESIAAWRERHWERVEAAEQANAALREVLPKGGNVNTVPATSAPRKAAA